MVNKVLRAFLVLTLFLGALPTIPYVLARLTGALPSKGDWWLHHGGNHGPWWGGALEYVVMLPLLSLAFLSAGAFLVSLGTGLFSRQARVAFSFLLLAGLQLGLFFALERLVFWTVD